MTLEALIGIIGLTIAVYAVMPEHRRLELKLYLGWSDLLLGATCMLMLMGIAFYEPIAIHFSLEPWTRERMYLTRNELSFLIVLAYGFFAYLSLHFARLTVDRIGKFRQTCNELLWAKEYHRLALLIERHHYRLFRICNSVKADNNTFALVIRDEHSSKQSMMLRAWAWIKTKKPKWVESARFRFGTKRARRIESAMEVVYSVFTNHGFVGHLSLSRPYLALDIVNHDSYHKTEFLRLYIGTLIKDTTSQLYFELKSNQSWSGDNYVNDPGNRIIHSLIADSKRAESLQIWKPIGDTTLDVIRQSRHNMEGDPYNRQYEDPEEPEELFTPILAGITLFDILVRSAFFNKSSYDMWLFYHYYFVVEMTRNYECEGRLERMEFPNIYSKYIYDIVHNLKEWGLFYRKRCGCVYKPPPQPTEEAIPKSALRCLQSCMAIILGATTLPERFRLSIITMVWNAYFYFKQCEKCAERGRELVEGIVKCPEYECDNAMEYQRIISLSVERFDWAGHMGEDPDELRMFIQNREWRRG